MFPKTRPIRMETDDLAWEKSDEEADSWERSLYKAETHYSIAHLIMKYRPGEAVELHRPIRGGYNILFRLEFKDGSSAAMRIPCKGIVKFPDEKFDYEVAILRYVAKYTTIPVPKVYHHGPAAENPLGLGPFMIMDYIDHDRTMSHALNDPLLASDAPHALNNDIDEERLKLLYGQMANILLQLSTLSFSQIGSLVEEKEGQISVSGRPLIQNMNSLVEFASVPSKLLPSKQYRTSTEWYSAMADMHLFQATLQRNDAIVDEDDARDKFVARQLFRRLAASGQLATLFNAQNGRGFETTFRLYSEDLRPSNVLIDKDLRVVGVIDWEFAYVAPAEFAFDPPWWLLLKSPEYWPGGYIPWMEAYEPRFNTFLSVLKLEEEKMRNSKSDTSPPPQGDLLSERMRKRWESKTWLINYAARNSWAFDFIYWRFMDSDFFGPNEREDHVARLDLLADNEMDALACFVEMKMQDFRTRALAGEDNDDSLVRINKVFC
ncbi:hypothetical protein CDD83_2720 [Cordyceps sp. RAO-2017]|nr:hypothetical protein CDD83_2720 [Cordyceps sp. RAO-2017]